MQRTKRNEVEGLEVEHIPLLQGDGYQTVFRNGVSQEVTQGASQGAGISCGGTQNVKRFMFPLRDVGLRPVTFNYSAVYFVSAGNGNTGAYRPTNGFINMSAELGGVNVAEHIAFGNHKVEARMAIVGRPVDLDGDPAGFLYLYFKVEGPSNVGKTVLLKLGDTTMGFTADALAVANTKRLGEDDLGYMQATPIPLV